MEIWRYRDMESWRVGDMEIWRVPDRCGLTPGWVPLTQLLSVTTDTWHVVRDLDFSRYIHLSSI